MSSAPFRVASFDPAQDRSTFNSGSEPLDSYFQHRVAQDIRRRVTACFVALTRDRRIAGYYTLASASLPLPDLPAAIGRKLPRYPSVPTVRLGRLAVDLDFEGQGLGGALLADAIQRPTRAEIAAYAMIVDAKNESAVAFYRHHGFIALPTSFRTLFLPLATVRG